ncbi:macro domain-containing protein CT2219-like [Oppia nitens]|uniref:macro domain-containing protein CT2219-like n=1 Tax=Oppia nitens TaxID=1686743 RepID=UPI0023DAC2D5|nr:macro domain-containing protein CT2219-like [Oppia nitens]
MFGTTCVQKSALKTSLSSLFVLSLIKSINYHSMAFNEVKQRYLTMSTEEKRKQYKCGDNYKTLLDTISWTLYSKTKHINKQFSSSDYVFNREFNDKIAIFSGDITALEVDAIVNAANKHLKGGGGVDGAIHSAAGFNLLQAECKTLNGCETGNSKITGGYKLPAKYVIHTVGPVGEKPTLLQSCYKTSLDLMAENKLKSIAFPCISTGIYGYPNEEAANVALNTARQWLDTNPYAKEIERIIFCLFLPIDIDIYTKLLPIYFPIQ